MRGGLHSECDGARISKHRTKLSARGSVCECDTVSQGCWSDKVVGLWSCPVTKGFLGPNSPLSMPNRPFAGTITPFPIPSRPFSGSLGVVFWVLGTVWGSCPQVVSFLESCFFWGCPMVLWFGVLLCAKMSNKAVDPTELLVFGAGHKGCLGPFPRLPPRWQM